MSAVVVTGAGRGIGLAAVLRFAERGLDVALIGPHLEHLEEAAGLVRQRGVKALCLRCDVSVGSDVDAARERVLRELGAPIAVVNNAGVVERVPVHTMSELAWDHVINVNLKGTFLVSRAFLPSMLAVRTGRVVSVGSISSTLGTAHLSAYCAAKWGVVGFTKALAEELRGTGLQALCVLPGSVDTDMLKGSGFSPQMSADDVARTLVYASLDAPAAMNGSAMEMFGP